MRVYVVRHGESENNKKQCWTGWLDVPLTDKGKEDARTAGELLQKVSFSRVFASDLQRAMETAENALPGIPYETSPLLREIHVGTLQDQPLSVLSDGERVEAGMKGYAAFDGESKQELLDRVHRFRDFLETLDCEAVAIFSHAGWLFGMLESVLEIPLPRKHIACRNCTVAVFDYTDGIWRLHSWINLV
jgi:probable phosphoglycerate mutase